MNYLMLAFSIALEVVGTSLMKKTEGFTNIPITAGMLVAYGIAFYLLSHVVKTLPIGVVYATWSAGGIVLVTAVAYFFYKQTLDLPAIIGMAFIIVGVVLMNAFSNVSAH